MTKEIRSITKDPDSEPRRFGLEELYSWLFYLADIETTEVLSPVETRPSVVFLFEEGLMKANLDSTVCKQVASVKFWDGYARWYKLWVEHTQYHQRIIEILLSTTEPGWRVLDIGAGNGILSVPLSRRGCEVTALEPSIGMRNLLYEEAFKNRIDALTVDERIWEEALCYEYLDYDLIIACNTLHLTQIGFEEALAKIFRTRPRNVFLITELGPPEIRVKCQYGDYTMVFTESYETDNSYAYHHLNEMIEHWRFIKGRTPQPDELSDLKKRIILQEGHLWIKHTSRIMMCWWKQNGREKNIS
ncbi:MAG: methyltransferase domain-containing protein [Syntrophaceae bacterium]|nr:methyltransferase domain-containing protein [Syntrophaceae bacterium]